MAGMLPRFEFLLESDVRKEEDNYLVHSFTQKFFEVPVRDVARESHKFRDFPSFQHVVSTGRNVFLPCVGLSLPCAGHVNHLSENVRMVLDIGPNIKTKGSDLASQVIENNFQGEIRSFSGDQSTFNSFEDIEE
ncbi:hypothetical protein FXO38_15421 [Capsicum annuum]|nr:hypothetical protein FXO37_32852 [Capsicum annuum]KAF3653909.1 hypothetical protein FXO38_15421 [Capsicum annuum]